MFKVNLEEELINSKKASLTKEEQIVLAEAEKILTNSTEEDISILKKMGLNYSVEKSKNFENKIKFIKAFDKTRVFSTDEIKDLCVTYGLRFLHIEKFKGEIDPLVPSKVKEFEATYNQVITDKSWRNEFRYDNFMICAPKESFQLSERPKDPLLFYPIANNEGDVKDYFLVHKWGSDISAFNAIKSWRNRNFFTWVTYLFSLYIAPLLMLTNWMFNLNLTMVSFLGIGTVSSFAWGLIVHVVSEGEFFSGRWTENNWNSKFKD